MGFRKSKWLRYLTEQMNSDLKLFHFVRLDFKWAIIGRERLQINGFPSVQVMDWFCNLAARVEDHGFSTHWLWFKLKHTSVLEKHSIFPHFWLKQHSPAAQRRVKQGRNLGPRTKWSIRSVNKNTLFRLLVTQTLKQTRKPSYRW